MLIIYKSIGTRTPKKSEENVELQNSGLVMWKGTEFQKLFFSNT